MSNPYFNFALNLKFTETDSMKALLDAFPMAEELIVFSKNFDVFDEAMESAAKFMQDLCDSFEKRGLGSFGMNIERNLELLSTEEDEAEEISEDLQKEHDNFDPEEWTEGEMLKIWIYDITTESELTPVALAQVIQHLDGVDRVTS